MKNASLVVLLTLSSAAYAELPPVIDHSSYPASAEPVRAVATPPSTALLDASKRIEQLQAEVQQLTGKVDEQAFRIEELKKQQKTMYADFDERVQSLENKANGVDPAAADPAAVGGAEAVPAPAVEPAPAAAEPPAAPETPAPETPAPEAAAPEPVPVPATAEIPPAAPAPAPADVPSSEKLLYQQAYSELRKGHTNQSIEQFNSYLASYPGGALASNSQYWLGEAYRVNQDAEAARKAFTAVIDNYPGSAKVPDALLSLGNLEMEQQNPDKAREYLNRVIADYANTAAAQKAAKKLQKLDAVKN